MFWDLSNRIPGTKSIPVAMQVSQYLLFAMFLYLFTFFDYYTPYPYKIKLNYGQAYTIGLAKSSL